MKNKKMFVMGMIVFSLFLFSADVFAQDSVLLQNYNRIPIGELGGLEGGAFSARADDASAAWYNPAGLVKAKRNSLSGNASAFEQTTTQFGEAEGNEDINSIANFAGNVSRYGEKGEPVQFVWSFSIVSPMEYHSSSTTRFENSYNQPDFTADNITGVVSSTANLSTLAPGLSVGYAVDDDLRIGAGIRYYKLSLSSHQSFDISQGLAAGSPYYHLVENSSINGSADLLRYEFGVQYDISDELFVGFAGKTQSMLLRSSGAVKFSSLEAYDTTDGVDLYRHTNYIHADNDEIPFAYQLPNEMVAAVAWVNGKWEVELDLKYYSAVPEYDMFGDFEFNVVEQDAYYGDEYSLQTDSITNYNNAVLNLALGGRFKLSDSKWLHGGFFTDDSPGGAFEEVDLSGFTFGYSSVKKNTSSSFGFAYISGSNPSATIMDPVTLEEKNSTLTITTLSLMISGSVYF